MKIAICDDNPDDLGAAVAHTNRYAEEHNILVTTRTYGRTEDFFSREQEEYVMGADLVIFDIRMQGEDTGVQAARRLRKNGYRGSIVFATVSGDYYAEGFEVEALHYLKKPVQYADFSVAMDRAVRHTGGAKRYLRVPSNRKVLDIPYAHILFIDVHNHSTVLHTTIGPVPTSCTLRELEAELSGDGRFLRCYRSHLVNLEHVLQAKDSDFLMDSGERVPITRRYRAQMKDQFMSFLFRK